VLERNDDVKFRFPYLMNDFNLRVHKLYEISCAFTYYVFALHGVKFETFLKIVFIFICLFVLCNFFEFKASNKFVV
jgi:hypothetical protein